MAIGRHRRQDIDLRKYQSLLWEKKGFIERGLNAIMEKSFSESQKVNSGESGSYDQHSADLALDTFEREKDLGLKDGLEIDQNKIDLALERIREGTYGYCLRCHEPIPEGRLESMPDAELCIHCQEEEEVTPVTRRPVEEMSTTSYMRGIETLTDDPYAEGSQEKDRAQMVKNVLRLPNDMDMTT
ncbi:MAG: TraR/DksA C4-type zinc finger protein [Bacillota bacterium]|jgi:RNA polymerase-binding transcription factor DksA